MYTKDLTLNEFLERREKKTFTDKQIEEILKKNFPYYKSTWISTGRTDPGKWTGEEVRKFRETLKGLNLPYFVYIKFYTQGGEKYALVAGKTNSWRDDIYFEELSDGYNGKMEDIVCERKDKAKKWLSTQSQKGAKWYCEEVLLVYDPKNSVKNLCNVEKDKEELAKLENLAFSIEADIGGLFGLFSS